MMEKMIALQRKAALLAAALLLQQEGRLYAGRADRRAGHSGDPGSSADPGADWIY